MAEVAIQEWNFKGVCVPTYRLGQDFNERRGWEQLIVLLDVILDNYDYCEMSPRGRVSRASPVQTAMRNCTRDEGGPFGFGDQEPIPSYRKLLRSKSHGGERCGKVGTMIPASMVERGERKRTTTEVSKAD